MPIRNPFARRHGDDGALRPPLNIEPALKTTPGFERIDTVGSKASSSSAVSITSRQSQDVGEYKMSGTIPHPAQPTPCMAVRMPCFCFRDEGFHGCVSLRNKKKADTALQTQWSMTVVSTYQ